MASCPRILSIAGSDSGGGAGIQADIRTITNLGGHAMTAITAVTAQNSAGVTAVDLMSPDMVLAQIWAVMDDFDADAIKIGMLGSPEIALAVAGFLKSLRNKPVVFDPVMVATSGATLADDRTIAAFHKIIPLSSLVTPNLDEMERLGGENMIAGLPVPFLIKGGHGEDAVLVDRLIGSDGEQERWEGSRIDTRHSHGTGCTLSAAIATYLASGDSISGAIGKARDYVRASLKAAPGFGAGHGPMGVPKI
ncbi:bifunctional hydroxymethylpyrimidine kinase/phosphomethylpyrimidine kinase [Parasphingorhabdus cellanae]|uniref:hydroxymethylpyrimidine kinase n=1 Tax=Parasphingorhabdus cellanae TaxID=2806553 RepID=A0ABX7T4V6_9SPHN|nr:bifunctional hydroxymethylpyrimidine kinase/phosphomethylpyrimidine kinase [Parasphingorhabdus cellanae]QTD56620.1 bifunctional hydroxymethylpyrimidine kinase/phosphomethylpyrimidine kinase [Parasphingorhabdus cellanae]